jgi:alanyl-tRNA synthetase
MANEIGISINFDEYNAKMKEKIDHSGIAHSLFDSGVNFDADCTAHLDGLKVPATNDSMKYRDTELWNDTYINATIQALFKNNKFEESVEAGDQRLVGVILDGTNFYAEAGGQIFDTGYLVKGNEALFKVVNVQNKGGYILHIGYLLKGNFKVNDTLNLQVDPLRRRPVMSNHTFTHVLNFALRKVLVNYPTDQKGSLVDAEKLRFDFSCPKALTEDEIRQIEAVCNNQIRAKLAIYSKSVALEEARRINGLRAVFGENYPDPVNVVSIGKPVEELLKNPSNPEWLNYSIEFCGGTHLKNTSEAVHFVVISESSIAKGIRRIVAWTGEHTRIAYENQKKLESDIESAKQLKGEELIKRIAAISTQFTSLPVPLLSRDKLQKQIDALVDLSKGERKDKLATTLQKADEVIAQLSSQNLKFILVSFDMDLDKKNLGKVHLKFTEKFPDLPVMNVVQDGKSFTVIATVPKALTSKVSAADWAKTAAVAGQGSGGGKPETAQGNGKLELIHEALNAAKQFIESKL